MKIYEVVISPISYHGILEFLSWYGDDYQAEYMNKDKNGNEVWILETEIFSEIEEQIDTSDEVISYREINK